MAPEETIKTPITLTLAQAFQSLEGMEDEWYNLLRATNEHGGAEKTDIDSLDNASNPHRIIGIGDVLAALGIWAAADCIKALQPRQRVSILIHGVKRAAIYTNDNRVHKCIAAIERWLSGDNTTNLADAISAAHAAITDAETALETAHQADPKSPLTRRIAAAINAAEAAKFAAETAIDGYGAFDTVQAAIMAPMALVDDENCDIARSAAEATIGEDIMRLSPPRARPRGTT